MGQAAEPYRTAMIVVLDPERRGFAGTVLEQSFQSVVEASSSDEAMRLAKGGVETLAFAFVDLTARTGEAGGELARSLALRFPHALIALACDQPDAVLPRNVAVILRPWSALDLLVEAERVIGGMGWRGPVTTPRQRRPAIAERTA